VGATRERSAVKTGIRKSNLLAFSLYGLAALALLALSWQGRTYINPDGISYLDVAREMLKANPGAYFHPYWSPLFPALLALAIKLVSPAPASMLLLAHAVIALSALAALAAFIFFTYEWRYLLKPTSSELTQTAFFPRILFGLGIFLFATIKFIGTGVLTPDILAMAVVFALAAITCRIASGRGRTGSAIWLGLLLAIGYFTKAALLPLGLLLLLLLAISWFRSRARRMQLIFALLVFSALTVPYIGILSARQHKITFGESGRLNYAWSVLHNVPMYAGWTKGSQQSGTPVHPLKVLRRNPTVLAFDHTTPGTLPIWYNPSYFYQGLKVPFDLQLQLRQIRRAPVQILGPMRRSAFAILLMLIFLAVLARKQLRAPKPAAPWLILWSIGAYCMYSLVVAQPRYVAPFFALLLYLCAEELFARLPPASIRVGTLILILAASFFILDVAYGHTIRSEPISDQHNGTVQQELAEDLTAMGALPNDKIAVLGDPLDVYFAFLDHLHVVATIGFRGGNTPGDANMFWAMDAQSQQALEDRLAALGITAIVSTSPCDAAAGPRWRPIGNRHGCALIWNRRPM
jgi:hypothetical protein